MTSEQGSPVEPGRAVFLAAETAFRERIAPILGFARETIPDFSYSYSFAHNLFPRFELTGQGNTLVSSLIFLAPDGDGNEREFSGDIKERLVVEGRMMIKTEGSCQRCFQIVLSAKMHTVKEYDDRGIRKAGLLSVFSRGEPERLDVNDPQLEKKVFSYILRSGLVSPKERERLLEDLTDRNRLDFPQSK